MAGSEHPISDLVGRQRATFYFLVMLTCALLVTSLHTEGRIGSLRTGTLTKTLLHSRTAVSSWCGGTARVLLDLRVGQQAGQLIAALPL